MKFNYSIKLIILLALSVNAGAVTGQTVAEKPLRIAVAGLAHGHNAFILGRKPKGDVVLTGVFEKDAAIAEKNAKRFNFSASLIYNDLDKMLDEVKPEAVLAFGNIYDHLMVVEKCAPRGIHVMVEKPLATTPEAAKKMLELARKYKIHLLTDYETSWYPSTAKNDAAGKGQQLCGHRAQSSDPRRARGTKRDWCR